MKINLIKTNKSVDSMGHGVLFCYSVGGEENKIPVAFLDEYRWLHGDPESVNLLLFALDQSKVLETGLSENDILSKVIQFVTKFIEHKGKIKRQGKILTWWNA